MNKTPLLDQMRADRQRREDEIADPLRAEIEVAGRMVESLQRRLRDIERALGNKLAEHMTEQIAYDMSSKLRQLVYEAAVKASGASPYLTINVPREVMFMNPSSMESEVLRRYWAEAMPRLSLRIDENPMKSVTVMDIRIPTLGVRCAMNG